MGNIKNVVVKSKSSNSAITSKSESRKNDKKTRSNAEIQPIAFRKRGVYVEKKDTQISLNKPGEKGVSDQKPQKCPIPRPGRKRFLASVLTILSKSTTGTQLTEANDPYFNKTKTRLRTKKKKEYEDDYIGDLNLTKKKPKYRSKVLNDNKNFELDQFVVLQSKKNINQTPSNYSENNSIKEPEMIKWSDFLPPLVKRSNSLTSKGVKEKKVTLFEEPETLIEQQPKKEESKILNFFVDLLETTFNVYNVQTESNQQPAFSEMSSKIALEIDEAVAKRLDINKPIETKYKEYDDEDPDNVYCITPHEGAIRDYERSVKSTVRKSIENPSSTSRCRRKLKSESFNYKKKIIPVTRSFIYQSVAGKKLFQKEQKRNLLNQLKEELRMDDIIYEEPQNFYQALKVMARNKRRSQKSIHFYDSKKPSDGDVFNCMYKRRRVLSNSAKSSKKTKSDFNEIKNFGRKSALSSSRKTVANTIDLDNEMSSRHSLEVYGYDYVEVDSKNVNFEPHSPKKRLLRPPKSELNDADTFFLSDSSINNYLDHDLLSIS